MMNFRHVTPINIRFFDIDAFGHVNNARYLTYLEEARIKYVDDIVQWKYGWAETGIILARAEIDFRIPALFKDNIRIFTRCSQLGTKSFTLEYKISGEDSLNEEKIYAMAKTVIVMFDYKKKASIPVPDDWRNALLNFEGEIDQK